MAKAGCAVAFNVNIHIDVRVIHVFPEFLLSHRECEAIDDVHDGTDFVIALFNHARSDDDVGTQFPCHIHREVVEHTTIDEQHAVFFHWLEHGRNGHGGTHGEVEIAMREDLLFVGFHIHGYASKRKWQIGEEVDAVGICLREAMEHLHHVLSFYQSCIHAA